MTLICSDCGGSDFLESKPNFFCPVSREITFEMLCKNCYKSVCTSCLTNHPPIFSFEVNSIDCRKVDDSGFNCLNCSSKICSQCNIICENCSKNQNFQ